MKKAKPINLEQYIALIPSKKDLFYEIDFSNNIGVKFTLEKLCEIEADESRIEEAWSHILYSISDQIHFSEVTDLFTSKNARLFN